jgi:FkbM family methyltransferase
VIEQNTIDFIVEHVQDGDVIHAGTCFGDFLPALSRAGSGKIWAFEPNPENYRCAMITILINDLQNVNLMNAGLGETRRIAKIVTCHEDGTSLGELSHIQRHSDPEGLRAVTVQIVELDDVIAEDRKITIIHLDVEGYEQQALTGGLATIRRCRPFLILETLPSQQWYAENLKPLGYHVEGQIDHNTLLAPTAVGF